MVIVQLAVAALLAAVLPMLIAHLLTSTTNAFAGQGLDRTAAMVRPRIAYGPKGWEFTTQISFALEPRAPVRNVRLIDNTGRTWANDGPTYPIPASALPLPPERAHRLWEGYDVATYPIQSGGHTGWLVISSDRRRPESVASNVASSFLRRFLWIIPTLILCSLIPTLSFLAKGTRAIRQASRVADAIDGKTLDVRLDAAALPLEVQPLAQAMNHALNRVQLSYSDQAEFAANVAHELRNPLAVIGCRISEISDPVLRQRMSASLASAVHVIDQVMMLTKASGEQAALEPVDLRSIAMEAIEASAPQITANERLIAFEDRCTDSPSVARANKELAKLALANLIDNAQRHTPPSTQIRIVLGPGPKLCVEDNGPGIAAADRAKVGHRHWRGSKAAVDGAGLGLSIVTRAMTNQGGSLQICESAGGARLALNFQSEVAPQTIGASTSFQSGRDGTPASPPPPSPHYSI